MTARPALPFKLAPMRVQDIVYTYLFKCMNIGMFVLASFILVAALCVRRDWDRSGTVNCS